MKKLTNAIYFTVLNKIDLDKIPGKDKSAFVYFIHARYTFKNISKDYNF